MKLNREDIHQFVGNSNINEEDCEKLLLNDVFNSTQSWRNFLKIILLTFGVGFLLSGIIFFFAYNWDDLHKFAKLGITQSLIPVGVLFYVFYKRNDLIRDLGAIAATIMVGVSYAVYGQIYQTGANDFDFFMNWSLSVAIWVVVTNSLAHWLVFITLLNISLITYSQQYAYDWTFVDLYGFLFLLNSFLLITFVILAKKTSFIKAPKWFTIPIGLAVVYFSTVAISSGIHMDKDNNFSFFLIMVVIIYALGIYVGYTSKRLFYLGSIYFSLLIIICSFFLDFTKAPGEAVFLFLSFIVVGSISFIVIHFLNLQKQWKNESRK